MAMTALPALAVGAGAYFPAPQAGSYPGRFATLMAHSK